MMERAVLSLITAFVLLRMAEWSELGPLDPSFRARSGRIEFTVRRHKFNEILFPLKEGSKRPKKEAGSSLQSKP
jgi:hypothetical protein